MCVWERFQGHLINSVDTVGCYGLNNMVVIPFLFVDQCWGVRLSRSGDVDSQLNSDWQEWVSGGVGLQADRTSQDCEAGPQ